MHNANPNAHKQLTVRRRHGRHAFVPQAYWPEELADEESDSACAVDNGTANLWIAVSDVPVESGCMRYLPGSHLPRALRPHQPRE
jgi:ectoine hydroxylase-related dioxygenase (phytanoyl-CoA dioxygenase family)